MDTIDRLAYLDKIKSFVDKDLIKVFVGQRRVGKSYLIKSTINHILKSKPSANIIYIDKELYDYDHISTFTTLLNM